MKPLPESLPFTVHLTSQMHQQAWQLAAEVSDAEKRQQIYFNLLAVQAVNFYCKCIDIPTAQNSRDSQDAICQILLDVADLQLENLGKIECRPILPNEAAVRVPAEVWENRIGYIAVRLDASLREASLIGFLPNADREEIPIEQWESLDDFLDCLEELERQAEMQPEDSSPSKPPVKLSKWLQNIFDVGWETVENLLDPQVLEPSFQFRHAKTEVETETSVVDRSASGIVRGKVLQLDAGSDATNIALLVWLQATSDHRMDVRVEIHGTQGNFYLPKDLHVSILDESLATVMQAEARSTRKLEFEFTGDFGDRFYVRTAWKGAAAVEAFII
ncbi:DUF1822 family protein [Geitlerinema sp. PCC 9228]|uniref:DUF1822 family protein n=1 Tax=Geitlerinema sp. PCC 9228 TaxID=111611 RepID=UPI0008F98B18|nr:DUF1822 family protein [Geitlerinema sp. PCC 9228]